MGRLGTISAMLVTLGSVTARAPGPTWAADKLGNTREINVVRSYKTDIVKGEKNVVILPAVMSFWGATNQQVITRCDFTYSLKPDKIEAIVLTGDDPPTRRYKLTWNAPPADTITVTEQLAVKLACDTTLCTAVKLPYPQAVLKRFAHALGTEKNINPSHPQLQAVSTGILAKATTAEDAVERVCDWVNENIRFRSGSPAESDRVLSSRVGNCVGMSNLACALLRKAGIPAEPVHAKFVTGDRGHVFMEVYFPDAGWVFYDVSNSNRGFKTLDCVMTAGWGFCVDNSKGTEWREGYFWQGKDTRPWREVQPASRNRLRPGPKGQNVVGARVSGRAPLAGARLRHRSLRQLMADLSVPPGVREYGSKPGRSPAPGTAPAPPAPAPADPAAAGAKLRLAKVYADAGMKDKAAAIYREILKKYPATKAAETAKGALERLGQPD